MRALSLPVCSPGVLQRNTGTCADARHEQYSGQAPVSAEDRGAKNTGGVYRWWCMSNADPLTWGMRPICTLECVEDERNACMHVDIAADAAPFPGPAVAAVHYGLPLLSPRPWLMADAATVCVTIHSITELATTALATCYYGS